MQEESNCFFFIADYHSLTTHPTPENLRSNVRQVLAEYLACGIDPEKSVIYVQSDVPEVAELYLLLNMNAYVGELERSTTFKEKVRKQPDNVNAGLLTYPVLMAADILLHRAAKVPVGKDQEQHLEMTRQFGNRFNRMYQTEYFVEPVAYNFGEQLVKVPGLDGSGKMGKSEGEGNAVFLFDTDEAISAENHNILYTPVFYSFRILSQYLLLSFSPVWMDGTSFCPSSLIPRMVYAASFLITSLSRTEKCTASIKIMG